MTCTRYLDVFVSLGPQVSRHFDSLLVLFMTILPVILIMPLSL